MNTRKSCPFVLNDKYAFVMNTQRQPGFTSELSKCNCPAPVMSDIISEIKKFLICHGQALECDIRDCVDCDVRKNCPSSTIFLRFVIYQHEANCCKRFSVNIFTFLPQSVSGSDDSGLMAGGSYHS
jgi:hypothetical protein